MDDYKVDSVQANQERKKSVELYLEALDKRQDPNVDLAASASRPVRMSRWFGRKYKEAFGAWNKDKADFTPQEASVDNLKISGGDAPIGPGEGKLETSEEESSLFTENRQEAHASSCDGERLVKGYASQVLDQGQVQPKQSLESPESILSSIYKKIPSPRLEKRKFPFTVSDACIIKSKTEEYIFAMLQAKERIIQSLEAKCQLRDSLRLTLKDPLSLRRPSGLLFGDQYLKDIEAILQKEHLKDEEVALAEAASNGMLEHKQVKDIQRAIDYAEQHAAVLDQFIRQDPCSQEAIYYALELYEEAALVALRKELQAYEKTLSLDQPLQELGLETRMEEALLTEQQLRKEIYDLKLLFNTLPIDTKAGVIGSAKVKMEEILARNELFRGLDVKTKLKNAQVYCLNTRPWEAIENSIRLFFDSKEWLLKSCIVPAKKLGNIFLDTYECNGVCSHTISENVHAVNLAKTALFGPDGELWFEAYRHGVHCAYGVESQHARWQANINRAVETIQAMVISDPFILKEAETYSIHHPLALEVLSINLQTGDRVRSMSSPILGNLYNERLHIEEQGKAWKAISDKIHEVKYYDTEGSMRGAFVKPSIHSVNFGVNSIALEGLGAFGPQSRILGSWKNNMAMNKETFEWLFGENASLVLLGKVGNFLSNPFIQNDALKNRVYELATQIVDIYNKGAYASMGNEPYKIVTRLAYMCYLMGMKVAFNCKSGKDRTGMMDVETKFLVTRTCVEGKVPPVDENLTQEHQEALYMLAVFSGNHEMQKMNTGIAGYKPDNSQTIQRLGGEWVTTYLRGPSVFVSA